MIQIQDDFQTDSASTQSALPTPQPQVEPAVPATSAPTQTPSTPTVDKNQDIDDLLRQIEELSKQLENEKKQDTQVGAEPMMPAAAPAVEPMVNTPAVSTEPVSPPASDAAGDTEEFDLDSFLKDLEKRIQEDEAKNPPAPATVNDEQKPVDEQVVPAPAPAPAAEEDAFRKNRSFVDATDVADLTDKITEPASADSAPTEEASAAELVAELPPTTAPQAVDEESLQMQNIFDMLGLDQISDEEKNQFLDELEQLIWNDFVEKDLPLLLTSTEHEEAKKIMADPTKPSDAGKEALLNYLSSLIPDLEDILYQKALELKAEMFAERLKRMSTDADEAMSAKLQEAKSLATQNRYKSAVKLLV